MSIKIKFQKSLNTETDIIVLFVSENAKLAKSAQDIDRMSSGLIKVSIDASKKFKGKFGEFLTLSLPEQTGGQNAICVGLGKTADLTLQKLEELGGKLYAEVEKLGVPKAKILNPDLKLKKISDAEFAANLATGFKLRSYKFDLYKTKKETKNKFKDLTILTSTPEKAAKIFEYQNNVIAGVFSARDLVNEPPNQLTPPIYALRVKKQLAPLGIKIEILDDKKIKALGMGGVTAVGQGSANKPRVVIMRWLGAPKSRKDEAPIALVGKGVTFDTGGISIKPAAGMDQMKMDMGGSAAVVGAMEAVARNKLKSNVIGIIGLAENMPSDNAYRPGDIIKSYAGKTIEVLNTDAEGRLVLADCLTYVQEKYKPDTVIDLATLTGAMMVALGFEYCGTFANDDKLWKSLESASEQTGEKLWRMPLDEVWKKEMESQVADLQNLGSIGRWAGACTAAGFLEHFIEDKVKWAHLDIAGTAWIKKDKPTVPKFGTGFGVRILEHVIANRNAG